MERMADLVTAWSRIGFRVCDEIFKNYFLAASFPKKLKRIKARWEADLVQGGI